jgi:ribosomal-protein-alanine N-acetyltransferase
VPPEVALRLGADNPFLPFLQAQGPRVLVAELDGEAAGLGACEGGDDTISDVWVAPAFEGRGAGTALIRALEGEIALRGFAVAKIEAAAANTRALGLYRHLGYRDAWRDSYLDPILQVELEKIGLTKPLTLA